MSMNEQGLLRLIPDGEYEYLDVTFTAAATDTVIPYIIITPEDPETVRWMDVTRGAVDAGGGTDTVASVYRSAQPSRIPWARGYIVLRSSVAGYTTRLKLWVERL